MCQPGFLFRASSCACNSLHCISSRRIQWKSQQCPYWGGIYLVHQQQLILRLLRVLCTTKNKWMKCALIRVNTKYLVRKP